MNHKIVRLSNPSIAAPLFDGWQETCTSDFVIMTPQREAWAKLIDSCYQEKAKQVTRYSIKKEQDMAETLGYHFDHEYIVYDIIS